MKIVNLSTIGIKRYFTGLEIWEKILLFALLIIIFFVIRLIYVGFIPFVHSDVGVFSVFVREIIYSRQFLPIEWGYANGLWTFSLFTFMLPLSLFFDDYLMLRSTAVLLNIALLFAILVAYGKRFLSNRSHFVYIPVIFSLASVYQNDNMFVQGSYGFLVMYGLLVFFLLSRSVDNKLNINWYYLLAGCALLISRGMGGSLRNLGEILIPAIVAVIVVYMIENKDGSFAAIRPHIQRFALWCTVVFAAVVVGFLFYSWLAQGFIVFYGNVRPNVLGAAQADMIMQNVQNLIASLWAYYGVNSVPLFSVRGFLQIVRYILPLVILIVLPAMLTMNFNNENIYVRRLVVFSWASFAVILFMTILTQYFLNSPAAIRYYQFVIVLQTILSGHFLYRYVLKRSFMQCASGFLVLMFVLVSLNFNHVNYVVRHRHDRDFYLQASNQLGESLRDRGLSVGFATFWNAYNNSLKLNFNPEIFPLLPMDLRYTNSLFPSLMHASGRFFRPEFYEGRTFLLLTQSEYSGFLSNPRLQFLLGEPIEVFEQGLYVILIYDYNIVLSFVGIPFRFFNKANEYLDFQVFRTQNGKLTERGMASDGTTGFVLYGPYITLPPGSFSATIKMCLKNQSYEQIAWADVYATPDLLFSLPIFVNDFDEGSLALTLPFYLHETTSHIEFRVVTREGTVLTVESVFLRRYGNIGTQ